MIKKIKTSFKDLVIFEGKKYKDKRGYLIEILRDEKIGKKFKFQILSKSKKNVLRGLHFQLKKPQAKHVTVIKGKILDVAVDLRKKSKTFGKHFSTIISERSDFSFYIPEGFAHGFLCLSNKCIISYKCSKYRDQKSETTLSWNDKNLKIKWPIKKPILSKKDKIGKNLNYFK